MKKLSTENIQFLLYVFPIILFALASITGGNIFMSLGMYVLTFITGINVGLDINAYKNNKVKHKI